jgi:hypothetical protein
MYVGQTYTCDLGQVRTVNFADVSVGCNDGETGEYRVRVDTGGSSNVRGFCDSNARVGPLTGRVFTLTMTSGGGGDSHVSFDCCGSSGWNIGYR